MKVIKGLVNDLPDNLKPKKLKPNETAVYRLLGGVENPDPDNRRRVPLLYPQSVTIPSKDRINDPESGDYYDIAIVDRVDKDKNVFPVKMAIRAKENDGFFYFTGGNIREEEMYEYCEICNYNQSNENRDKSEEPRFYRVDEQKVAKESNRKRSVLTEALVYSGNLTDGDAKEFAASLGWDENMPSEILRSKIGHFAMSDPEGFIKSVQKEDRGNKAFIKKAISSGILSYDSLQHRIVQASNGITLMKLDRVEGVDYLTQASDWLANAKQGEQMIQRIKKLMHADKPEE